MKKEKSMRSICFYIAGLLIFVQGIVCPASASAAEKAKVLTVAFPETRGLNEVYEDGTFGGMVYDWLIEVSKYTGWEYEFVTGDASEVLDGMIAGEYDLMGGMYYQPEYEKYFAYPQYTMGYNYSLLIYREEDPTIKSFDQNTMNGKTIGVLERSKTKIEQLKTFLISNDLKCEIRYYDAQEDYENCLQNGEVDLMLGSDLFLYDGYNVAAKFASEGYYLVAAADRPDVCAQLDGAMAEIYSANPSFAQELYDRYFSNYFYNSVTLSDADRTFIQQKGVVRVAVVKDRVPTYYKKEDVYQGVVPEVFQLISESTGMQFEFIVAQNYTEMLELVQNGKADLASSFMGDQHSADKKNVVITKQYAELDEMMLRNKHAGDPEDDVLAVMSGMEPGKNLTYDKVVYYPNYEDCVRAVNNGVGGFYHDSRLLYGSAVFRKLLYQCGAEHQRGDQDTPVNRFGEARGSGLLFCAQQGCEQPAGGTGGGYYHAEYHRYGGASHLAEKFDLLKSGRRPCGLRGVFGAGYASGAPAGIL